MKTKLSNIADVNFGPHLKSNIKGPIKYLLASHFNKLHQPSLFKDSYTEQDNRTEKYLLQKNDVILTGKGNNLFAWAYSEDFGACIPSSLFYIIKTDPNIINSQYLAYYFNTNKMNAKLTILGAGASVPSIPKKEIFALNIEIPNMQKQLEIIKIVNTSIKNIELTKNILNLKTKLHAALLSEIIE